MRNLGNTDEYYALKCCVEARVARITDTVNYIYFLLSGSKCLWFTNMENITLISL
jgi:hypothetical protein